MALKSIWQTEFINQFTEYNKRSTELKKVIKNKDTYNKRRTSSKIKQEKVEILSGQSFLLLKNEDFLTKLRIIKDILETDGNPIILIISEFVKEFINQNRLLMYLIDYNPDNAWDTAQKINTFEEISAKVEKVIS